MEKLAQAFDKGCKVSIVLGGYRKYWLEESLGYGNLDADFDGMRTERTLEMVDMGYNQWRSHLVHWHRLDMAKLWSGCLTLNGIYFLLILLYELTFLVGPLLLPEACVQMGPDSLYLSSL